MLEPTRARLMKEVSENAEQIVRYTRELAAQEPPGDRRIRLTQLAEYAELVLSLCNQAERRPPAFAGRFEDDMDAS